MAAGHVPISCVLLLVCLSVTVGMSLLDRLKQQQQQQQQLQQLQQQQRRQEQEDVAQYYERRMSGAGHKRLGPADASGNPCPDAEKPFPCKSTRTCIPMGYLCDDNIDCEDGYDEDRDVCTAAHRPPVFDIQAFLEAQKAWIMPNLFGDKNIAQVAHGLAVSPTVENFSRRLSLSPEDGSNLRQVLEDIKNGDDKELLNSLGMPASAFNEVNFIFSKLIKSGFLLKGNSP